MNHTADLHCYKYDFVYYKLSIYKKKEKSGRAKAGCKQFLARECQTCATGREIRRIIVKKHYRETLYIRNKFDSFPLPFKFFSIKVFVFIVSFTFLHPILLNLYIQVKNDNTFNIYDSCKII